jgi:hypothetical protein
MSGEHVRGERGDRGDKRERIGETKESEKKH